MQKSERIHSLDALRAVMLLFGLVLHSAMTYNVTNHGDVWPIKDPTTTFIISDFLVLVIHSFRMQIFFLIAGFFGSLLFYERRPLEMIKNRILRIGFPFIVFLFISWPLILFAFTYTYSVFALSANPFQVAIKSITNTTAFLPQKTSHLWFLYYLIFLTATSVLIAQFIKRIPKFTQIIIHIFNWIINRPIIRVLCLSGLIYSILILLGTYRVVASVSIIPDVKTYVYYLIFYLLGWALFKSKSHLGTLMKYDWLNVVLAIILVVLQGKTVLNSDLTLVSTTRILTLYSAFIVSLFIFGITGLFIRLASNHSSKMRYISDASYWVYLIHLPIVGVLPAFIWTFPIPAAAKFLIVLTITSLICFISYHYLVRYTFIGQFLNGKKHQKQ